MRLIALPFIFAFLGFLTTTDTTILFLDKLNPYQGLMLYYFIIFLTIIILQHFGLIIGGYKMQSLSQSIGEVLILFAFFMIFDWESGYIQWIVNKNKDKSK